MTPPGAPTVLLVDDQQLHRTSVAFHLAMAGYPVEQTCSVAEALSRSVSARPDLVIVSDAMADHDIADVLASLAEQPELVDVPVITLSSDPGNQRLLECLRVGARDHVRRQDGADVLVARVDALLRTEDELGRLRRRNAQLEFLGAMDPVTGMANRHHIEDELDRLSAGASRHRVSLSAVMVRVDYRTQPAGAANRVRRRQSILREVAFLVASVCRAEDTPGIWDDHTFLVLLPLTRCLGARSFAVRLRAVVDAAPVRCGNEILPLTLSSAYCEVDAATPAILARLEQGVGPVAAARGDGIDEV